MNKVAGSILIFVGALFCLYGLYEVSQTYRSYTWEQTTGEIIDSGIRLQSRVGRSEPSRWLIDLNYSYKIDNKEYTNEDITLGIRQNYRYQSSAQKKLDYFIKQNPLTVYYNPNNPQESFLVYPYNSILTILGMGLLILYGGISRFRK